LVATAFGGAVGRGRHRLEGWACGWSLLLWCWLLTSTACGSTLAGGPIAAWAEGPVRWLMLPSEQRQARRLRNRREAVLFIEFFWRRRDPTPADSGNPFLQTFHDRVQAADKLYGEEGVRGALTDRGRALILLGAPPVLRQRVRTILAADHDDQELGFEAPKRTEPELEQQILKDWVYSPDRLPPNLVELLDEEAQGSGIVLTFVEGVKHTRLIEGEAFLELAARALATPQPP
jgi:GWxTD domain-containing protein